MNNLAYKLDIFDDIPVCQTSIQSFLFPCPSVDCKELKKEEEGRKIYE